MKKVNPNILNKVSEEYKPKEDVKKYDLRLTTRIFVLDKDRNIGLMRHAGDKIFFPPGGGVEKGETFFQGAEREVTEELGVDCTPVKDLGVLNHYHEKWFKYFEIHHIYATTDRKEVKIDYEDYDTNLERAWINVDEYIKTLDDYVKNEKPDDVWAKAILYFLKFL